MISSLSFPAIVLLISYLYQLQYASINIIMQIHDSSFEIQKLLIYQVLSIFTIQYSKLFMFTFKNVLWVVCF